MNGGSVNKGFIETLLKKSDFPYIITLLLGLVAFGVTSIVDSITSTPVVMMEEEYVQPSKNKKGSYKLILTNLTGGTNFKGLTVNIESTNFELLFTEPKIRVLAPGTAPKITKAADNTGLVLTFSNLLPNVAFEVMTKVSLDEELMSSNSESIPHFRILDSSKGMSFFTPGLKTLLIQYEIEILLILCIICPLFFLGQWTIIQGRQ